MVLKHVALSNKSPQECLFLWMRLNRSLYHWKCVCVCVQLFSSNHDKCYSMVVMPNILNSTTYLFGILRYLLKCVCE